LPKIATGSCDKSVKIWEYDPNTEKKFKLIWETKGEKMPKDWIRDVAWCPAIGAPYELLVSCCEVKNKLFLLK
jgi:protein transport protein SEC13